MFTELLTLMTIANQLGTGDRKTVFACALAFGGDALAGRAHRYAAAGGLYRSRREFLVRILLRNLGIIVQ